MLTKEEAIIEAVLFTMGDSVEVEKIAAAMSITVEEVREHVSSIMKKYEENNHGLKIIELENSYQMCTRPEMYEAIIKVATQPKKQVLTEVVLETLSIIAYKQPITRLEIEKIRGVKSDHAVNKLIEYNLIEEKGRLDAPGRPILFGTTEEFLRCFGVSSLKELPELSVEIKEEMAKEAEEEINIRVKA